MFCRKNKLRLSPDAMRVVARSLLKPDDMGGTPRASIMAGLRHDKEHRVSFAEKISETDPDKMELIHFHARMKFITGDFGSGKSSLMIRWGQMAAEHGYQTLSVSRDFPRAWSESDICVIAVPSDCSDVDTLRNDVRNALNRGEASLIHIMLPEFSIGSVSEADIIKAIISDFIADRRQNILFTIDDFDWRGHQDVLFHLDRYAETAVFTFATTSQRTKTFPVEEFTSQPTEILMYSRHDEDKEYMGINREELQCGEFRVARAPETLYFVLNDPFKCGKSKLWDSAIRAISHLERVKRNNGLSDYERCLWATARACGYLNWKTAQWHPRPRTIRMSFPPHNGPKKTAW